MCDVRPFGLSGQTSGSDSPRKLRSSESRTISNRQHPCRTGAPPTEYRIVIKSLVANLSNIASIANGKLTPVPLPPKQSAGVFAYGWNGRLIVSVAGCWPFLVYIDDDGLSASSYPKAELDPVLSILLDEHERRASAI